MSTNKFERFLPLAGVLAAVCFFVSDAPGLEAPALTGSHHAVFLNWMFAHGGRVEIAGVGAAFAAFFFLFFVGSVRSALRSRESGESTYSSVAFGAGVAYAGTLLIDALVTFAMGKAGGAHDQTSTLAIGWLQEYDWVPWAAASGVFLLALGLGGLRTLALPKSLAWVLVVLGVLSVAGPIGGIVFLLTPLWLVVTAIVLARRARTDAGPDHSRTPQVSGSVGG